MKKNRRPALAMLAGACLGVSGAVAIHAQQEDPLIHRRRRRPLTKDQSGQDLTWIADE